LNVSALANVGFAAHLDHVAGQEPTLNLAEQAPICDHAGQDARTFECSGLDRFRLEYENFLCLIAMVDNTVLTVKEVAALLRVDEKTVYRLAKKRALPGFKVAGAWRFKRADIESWIEQQKAAES